MLSSVFSGLFLSVWQDLWLSSVWAAIARMKKLKVSFIKTVHHKIHLNSPSIWKLSNYKLLNNLSGVYKAQSLETTTVGLEVQPVGIIEGKSVKVCLQVMECYCICGPKGSCVESDKLPQAMQECLELKTANVKINQIWECQVRDSEVTSPFLISAWDWRLH